MEIEIDETKNSIQIHDNEKSNIRYSLFMFVFIVFFFSLKLVRRIGKSLSDFVLYSSLMLIIVSVAAIVYVQKTRVSKASIEFGEIESLNERKIFGKTTYYLKLKNGKVRNLPPLAQIDVIERIREKLS